MPSDERLSEEKARLDAQLRRKLQEIETASRAERWITSKDSQPPK
jgi:hypothetical protein